jgi:hypothetical protein
MQAFFPGKGSFRQKKTLSAAGKAFPKFRHALSPSGNPFPGAGHALSSEENPFPGPEEPFFPQNAGIRGFSERPRAIGRDMDGFKVRWLGQRTAGLPANGCRRRSMGLSSRNFGAPSDRVGPSQDSLATWNGSRQQFLVLRRFPWTPWSLFKGPWFRGKEIRCHVSCGREPMMRRRSRATGLQPEASSPSSGPRALTRRIPWADSMG